MNKETMINESFEYAAKRFPNGNNKDCGIVAQEQYACRIGFAAGALWQRNHVWHETTERPQDNSAVLAIEYSGSCFICGPNHEGWEDTVKDLDLDKWAYVHDLVIKED